MGAIIVWERRDQLEPHLQSEGEVIDAEVVVDAAGAWGDVVAERAELPGLGLRPMRRTAFTTTPSTDTAGWPLVHAIDGSRTLAPCYFKPESGGQLLCSLADETLDQPGDARPDEVDVARAQRRVTRAAAMAKLHATEAAQRVIDAAVQIFGGLGVVSGHPVEQLYREIRALRIYEGASEVQKIVIARQTLAAHAQGAAGDHAEDPKPGAAKTGDRLLALSQT